MESPLSFTSRGFSPRSRTAISIATPCEAVSGALRPDDGRVLDGDVSATEVARQLAALPPRNALCYVAETGQARNESGNLTDAPPSTTSVCPVT